MLESRSMVLKDISHITIGSTRHCTRCPFVCMVASSHSHTQTANACNAHVPGVRKKTRTAYAMRTTSQNYFYAFLNRRHKKSKIYVNIQHRGEFKGERNGSSEISTRVSLVVFRFIDSARCAFLNSVVAYFSRLRIFCLFAVQSNYIYV